ncbi:MAG TPA: tetratricopeptide repeat protein [Thermoanaerobaculia bacterium]|nr:tetratricopeptide repeat protein [Thermoanaerobaculia bacterium]
MNNGSIDWTTAIIIAVAGLFLGALLVMFFRRRKPAADADRDLRRKDLEAKRDALVAQLRDPDLPPSERARLEQETAQVLRELDASPLAAERGESEGQSPQMNPTVKGFLWGSASTAALAALLYFVMQQATPREQNAPITGATSTAQQQQQDPMVMQLEAAVQREPDNLQLRNDLAQAYLERDNLMAVMEQTKVVLAKSPNDSRALTFQGLVRMAMGETETATRMLQQATKADPRNLDGWVALAWVYAQSNRMSDAESTMQEAMRQAPNDRARLEQVFEQMKQHVAQGGAPQQAQALPENHPPVAASGAGGVHVTLNLDPSATTRSGIVFVIARNPAGGPPVAVKRVVATSFPTTVELTSADSMMGQQLPASFRLEARLDTDGDPMTHPPTDPSAMQEGVAPGATVTLALK